MKRSRQRRNKVRASLTRLCEADSMVVFLHRPTSPFGNMTALSRQLTNAGGSIFSVGTPPKVTQDYALSRKVKSELNLTDLRCAEVAQNLPDAHAIGLSSIAQDTPQDITAKPDHLSTWVIECDAFFALKELGTLVAHRRGLDAASFVRGLMALLASAVTTETKIGLAANDSPVQSSAVKEDAQYSADDRTPRPPLRRPQSQSYQTLDQKRRRHFSFEPGDDQLQELENDLRTLESPSQTDSTDSKLSTSADYQLSDENLQSSDDDSSSLILSLGADVLRPSMIPSPVQMVGRVRRENSMSSLKSTINKNAKDSCHNSRASIQTAFREASSSHVSTRSKSQSSSNYNLHAAESPLGSKDQLKSSANRQSSAALAAARAAESRSRNLSRGNTQLSTATTTSRKRHGTGQQRTENHEPITCNNNCEKDAK